MDKRISKLTFRLLLTIFFVSIASLKASANASDVNFLPNCIIFFGKGPVNLPIVNKLHKKLDKLEATINKMYDERDFIVTSTDISYFNKLSMLNVLDAKIENSVKMFEETHDSCDFLQKLFFLDLSLLKKKDENMEFLLNAWFISSVKKNILKVNNQDLRVFEWGIKPLIVIQDFNSIAKNTYIKLGLNLGSFFEMEISQNNFQGHFVIGLGLDSDGSSYSRGNDLELHVGTKDVNFIFSNYFSKNIFENHKLKYEVKTSLYLKFEEVNEVKREIEKVFKNNSSHRISYEYNSSSGELFSNFQAGALFEHSLANFVPTNWGIFFGAHFSL